MSRPNRVRMLLVLAFVLTLVAGVVAGIGFASVKSAGPTDPSTTTKPPQVVVVPPSTQPDRNWLADQLGLNPRQREQVSAIWKETPHEEIRKLDSRRRNLFTEQRDAINALYTSEQRAEREKLYKECDAKVAELRLKRDEAVAALYSADQKSQKDKLNKEFAAKQAEATKEREKLLQPMLEKTRLVLNEDQRKRFDMMMRAGPGFSPGFSSDRTHRGGPTGRSGTGPSTRPGSQPSDWPKRDSGPRSPDGSPRMDGPRDNGPRDNGFGPPPGPREPGSGFKDPSQRDTGGRDFPPRELPREGSPRNEPGDRPPPEVK